MRSALPIFWRPDHVMTSSQAWWMAGLLVAVAGGLWWRQWRSRRPTTPMPGNLLRRLVFDLTFIFIAFDNLPRLLTGNDWSAVLLAALAGWRLAGAGALGLYWADPSSSREAG